MTLHTEVAGDPASCLTAADWLQGKYSQAIDASVDGLRSARGDSMGSWEGLAGEAFRNRMQTGAAEADSLGPSATRSGRALADYAHALESAKQRMRAARQIAIAGGLSVTQTTIEPPGPAPAPLPAPYGPLPPGEAGARAEAVSAVEAYDRRVQAYNEAAHEVTQADNTLQTALEELLGVLQGEVKKAPLTALGALASLTSGYSAWHQVREKLLSERHIANKLRNNPNLSRRGGFWAALIEREKAKAADHALKRATGSPVARAVDRMPPKAHKLLTANFGQLVPRDASPAALKGGRTVLSKMPIVGAGVTATGIGLDVATGKDIDQAVVSGVGSSLAGAGAFAVASMAGGPVGLAVGVSVIAGVGVGYGLDKAWEAWGDDIKEAASDVVDGATDIAGDAWDSATDALGF